MINTMHSVSDNHSGNNGRKLTKGDRIKMEIMSYLSESKTEGKTTREISDGVDVSIYATRIWLLRLLSERKLYRTDYKKSSKWFIMNHEM